MSAKREKKSDFSAFARSLAPSRWIAGAALALSVATVALPASAHDPSTPKPADEVPAELQDVGVVEKLGDQIPLDVKMLDETGKEVRLGQYFQSGKPVLLYFVYHSCPTLCSMVQSAIGTTVKQVPWDIGKKYEVVAVSIDPRDTPQVASEKKTKFVSAYGRDALATTNGWHFLVPGSSDAEVKRLASAFGWGYHYDEKEKQYAHPAAIFVLTPEGKIARYLYGIEYPANDVRLALAEAAQGRSTVSTVDRLLLYCYHYDPNARGYVLQAWNVMRLGAGVTVVLLGGFIALMFLRDRKNKRARGANASSNEPKGDDVLLPRPIHEEKGRLCPSRSSSCRRRTPTTRIASTSCSSS